MIYLDSNKGYNEEAMLKRYGRRLDGSKIDRKLIKGGKSNGQKNSRINQSE